MASKSKRARQQFVAHQKRSVGFKFLVGALVLMVVCVVLIGRSVSTPHKVVVNQEMGQDKFMEALSLTLGDGPEARMLPVAVRQRVQILVDMNKARNLGFEFDAHPTSQGAGDHTVMACVCDVPENVKPSIVLFPWFVQLTAQYTTLQRLIVFSTAFYHESTHLERWPLTKTYTYEDNLNEEMRAYYRTDLDVVRPLLEKGLWMIDDYRRIDQVIRNCGDKFDCLEFRKEIERFSPPPRTTSTSRLEWFFQLF